MGNYPLTYWVISHYRLPMNTKDHLLHDVEAFLSGRGMSATAFGLLSVNDGKFVARLRSGANMTLSTVDRVREFLATTHPDAHPRARPQDAA
jgi:hypothetical protein